MTDKHVAEVPSALEAVVARLGDLERALGPAVRPVVEAVRAGLIEAMAARDRGDVPGAVRAIGAAMDRLAAFADGLDASEAALMRRVAQSFRVALLRGDDATAKQSAGIMFERSGARERKRHP